MINFFIKDKLLFLHKQKFEHGTKPIDEFIRLMQQKPYILIIVLINEHGDLILQFLGKWVNKLTQLIHLWRSVEFNCIQEFDVELTGEAVGFVKIV